jgi:hypothetical protein
MSIASHATRTMTNPKRTEVNIFFAESMFAGFAAAVTYKMPAYKNISVAITLVNATMNLSTLSMRVMTSHA